MAEAKVLGLAVGPEGNETPIYREARDSVMLVEGKGVEGDKKFGKSHGRQVNLVTRHSYDWFERNFGRSRELPGGLGENIVISSEIDPGWLDLGQRIRVGEAVLEVVTPRAPCAHFTETVEGVKVSHFVGHVGLMCAVVKSGKVSVGDPAVLEE
ncbi:MAG: MOSC domain-containing protein [Planctomycetes bacterium]|nr:MOSC domain-containing protein [Planctomycetota bacterium]MCB9934318.1 MOSC domain-containing protein [Planctomycetota bacterium]